MFSEGDQIIFIVDVTYQMLTGGVKVYLDDDRVRVPKGTLGEVRPFPEDVGDVSGYAAVQVLYPGVVFIVRTEWIKKVE